MARQYSGTLGKVGNCQIGASVQMVTDQASVARPVAGDSGYGDAAEFRLGLTEPDLPYVLQVDP